jgi:Tol biopolymer transport system component
LIGQPQWLNDGRDLVVPAEGQLWIVSYPDGEARKITNYLNEYFDVSVAASAPTLVASQSNLVTNVWIAPAGDLTRSRQITSSAHEIAKLLVTTSDGRIVYPSSQLGNRDIWIMRSDGTHARPLTSNVGVNSHPSLSPDDRHVLFVSGRSGEPHVWKMNIDGSDPVQITRGQRENHPVVTPDGRWIVYVSDPIGANSDTRLWKIPFEGGEPVQISEINANWPAVSPDGRWIACFERTSQLPTDFTRTVTVLPIDGGDPVIRFQTPPGRTSPRPLRWTPDGKGITYVLTHRGVSNLWTQPFPGGSPRAITDFHSQQIWGFDWTREGDLVYSRGDYVRDIVLITGFR